jgi:hypothetical protein
MSSYANIPNIKEQTGWRVSFWFAVSSPLVDVPLGFLAAAQEIEAFRKITYAVATDVK